MNIGSKIQYLLDENNMSRKELGIKLGELLEIKPFEAKSVGNWIIGRNQPSLEVVDALSKIFNVNVGYFFNEESKESDSKAVQNALIDKIIDDLIEEGVLSKDESYESLDSPTQQILIGALNRHIQKMINNKNK